MRQPELGSAQLPDRCAWRKAVVIAVVLLLVCVVSLVVVSDRTMPRIGSAKIYALGTYLSRNPDDPDKKPQTVFNSNDPIQVGFGYEEITEEQAEDARVTFVVVNRNSNEEVFRTTPFQLRPGEDKLFVSVNNTRLPAGPYRVELRGDAAQLVAKADYSIK